MKKKLIIILVAIAIITTTTLVILNKKLGLFYHKTPSQELVEPNWHKEKITNTNYIQYKDEYDIKRNTDDLDWVSKKFYVKYIDYIAPNGKPIRIIGMDQITDEQLLYAYDMLSFYLDYLKTDVRDEIKNEMANSKATLAVANGADKDGTVPNIAISLGQNLNYKEIANIGSKWYIENDYEHRDASFEEIFHMVHDRGIGTSTEPNQDEKISSMIAEGRKQSLPKNKEDWGKKGLWGYESREWLESLEQEGSLDQEYIVSIIDSYYGLWEAFDEKPGGMWGIYIAKNRKEIKEKDPKGFEIIENILPKYIKQMFRIDSTFKGTFEMRLDEDNKYTYKSQYLQNLRLTGSLDSNISGNNLDNIFMPNSGKNTIDGKEGNDIVQFRGKKSEYKITVTEDTTKVEDTVKGRDGITNLKNIEVIRFIDQDN